MNFNFISEITTNPLKLIFSCSRFADKTKTINFFYKPFNIWNLGHLSERNTKWILKKKKLTAGRLQKTVYFIELFLVFSVTNGWKLRTVNVFYLLMLLFTMKSSGGSFLTVYDIYSEAKIWQLIKLGVWLTFRDLQRSTLI